MTATSVYELFETSTKAEAEGVWVDVGPFKFKLARAGGANEAFGKAMVKRFKPFQIAISNETMPEELAKTMLVDVFVDTVLLDWKDVGDRDGTEIPFTKEAAKKLFTELPNLFQELQAQAGKSGNFREANLKAAEGN